MGAFLALGLLCGCAKILGDFTVSAGVSSDDGSTSESSQEGAAASEDGSSGSLALGSPCASSSDCLSGACSDGVCCQTRCVESCKACNLAGSLGTCSDVPAGMNAVSGHPVCAVEPQSSCGQNGTCDGMGQCALWNDVVCRTGNCAATSNTVTADSKCNGQGSCVAPKPVTCAPYLCDPMGTGCYPSCTASTQCVSPAPCVSGSCGPKPNGATCSNASDCSSGNCIDGYCCDGACTGECEACDLPATLGTCSPVTSGQPHGTRAACAGTVPCGGSCTSASRTTCSFAANTVPCRSQSCSGSTLTAATGCDGTGSCPAPSTSACPSNLICDSMGTGCLTGCSSSSDCVGGAACTNGTCGSGGQANGTNCTSGTQCQSTLCVDSYCCNSACSGQCQACDVAGMAGVCSAVTTGQPHGSRTACSGSGVCQGTCTTASQTACSYPTAQCAAQSCTSGVVIAAANCNAGSCPSGATTSCAGFACNGAACATSCNTSNDTGCVSGHFCNGGSSCLTTLPNGRACSGASSCTTGYCANGYCCNTACTEGCDGCSATPGTCTPLAVGTSSSSCGNYLCQGATTCPTSCTAASQCTTNNCNTSSQCTTCFIAGTPVETERGLRAIESIGAGDRVRSFDTATGRSSWREVLKLERRVAPQIVAVTVGAGATIQVSPEHYFWVTGSGWVRARDLSPGDGLVASATLGGPALVSALSSLTTPADGVAVYNLVVEGFDDYFVGTNPVLVHSCHFLGFSSLSESELPR